MRALQSFSMRIMKTSKTSMCSRTSQPRVLCGRTETGTSQRGRQQSRSEMAVSWTEGLMGSIWRGLLARGAASRNAGSSAKAPRIAVKEVTSGELQYKSRLQKHIQQLLWRNARSLVKRQTGVREASRRRKEQEEKHGTLMREPSLMRRT